MAELSEKFDVVSITVTDTNGDNEDVVHLGKKGMILQIERLLPTYEYPGTWILDEAAVTKDSNMIFCLMCQILKELADLEENTETEMKYRAMTIISKKFVQVYLAIRMKLESADEYLAELDSLIRKCWEDEYFKPQYTLGVLHAFHGLQALMLSTVPVSKLTVGRLETVLDQLENPEVLDTLGQVGLMAVQAAFIGEIHGRSYDQREQLLLKMIALEPSSSQWKLWLYQVLRVARREVWNKRPGHRERSLIVEAANLDPDNPLVITSLCDTVAETLKHHGASWKGLEEFGHGRVFRTSQHMLEYLKTATRHALALDPSSVATNMAAAQIFSSIVPNKFRDHAFSKVCIDRALAFHPNSSKAHHRKGIYYLVSWAEANPAEAIVHFERAMDCDHRNFPVISDLLQTYLSDYERNEGKLVALLKRDPNNTDLSPANVGKLYFIQGVYLFMKNDFPCAIDYWVIGVRDMHCELENFKSLEYLRRRHGWPTQLFSVELVQQELEAALKVKGISAEKSATIGKLLEVLCPTVNRFPLSHVKSSRKTSSSVSSECRARGVIVDSKNDSPPRVLKHGECQYYQTLGVKQGASLLEINAAYAYLCYKYNDADGLRQLVGVDRTKGVEIMSEINDAYEYLHNRLK